MKSKQKNKDIFRKWIWRTQETEQSVLFPANYDCQTGMDPAKQTNGYPARRKRIIEKLLIPLGLADT